jgi:thioredoxin 1
MSVIHIESTQQFKQQILEHKGIAVIDFRAERCGPCRMLGPIIDQLSEEMKEIKFAKVNVEQQQELAATFQISSIPVVFFVKDGQVVDKIIGLNPPTVYKEKIADLSASTNKAA